MIQYLNWCFYYNCLECKEKKAIDKKNNTQWCDVVGSRFNFEMSIRDL